MPKTIARAETMKKSEDVNEQSDLVNTEPSQASIGSIEQAPESINRGEPVALDTKSVETLEDTLEQFIKDIDSLDADSSQEFQNEVKVTSKVKEVPSYSYRQNEHVIIINVSVNNVVSTSLQTLFDPDFVSKKLIL